MPSSLVCTAATQLKNTAKVKSIYAAGFVKLTQNVVARKTEHQVQVLYLYERYQSAYYKGHSTGIALIKIHSDISRSLDDGSMAISVLLDLSATLRNYIVEY